LTKNTFEMGNLIHFLKNEDFSFFKSLLVSHNFFKLKRNISIYIFSKFSKKVFKIFIWLKMHLNFFTSIFFLKIEEKKIFEITLFVNKPILKHHSFFVLEKIDY
jgi:hypothetical protein